MPVLDSPAAAPLPAAEPNPNHPILQPLRFPRVSKGPDGKLVVHPGEGLEVKNRVFRSSISGQFDHYNGTGSDVRINWEEKFAHGGVGAIISSFVPVHLEGRILPRYAMIHHNSTIKFWKALVKRVKDTSVAADGKECKYIIQLSHSGRQRDVPGVENFLKPSLSSTSKPDSFHGLLPRAMTTGEVEGIVEYFGHAAWRAKEAEADGVELHSAHGYLFTQFLSSAINDRTDKYGGPVAVYNDKGEVVGGRVKFLVDVITHIRERVGWKYHVQAKINVLDRNRAYFPLEWKDGNTLDEAREIFAIAEETGLNGLHVSAGSTFPHPLVPPGGFPADEASWWYGTMAGSGTRAFTNLTLFHFPWLRGLFLSLWNRVKKEHPIEGVTAALCKYVREDAVARAAARQTVVPANAPPGSMAHIPVLNTGGYQNGALIRRYLTEGILDGVSIARPLIANNDLVRTFEAGKDEPDVPCSFCNRCLLNALANPLACYDRRRFASDDEMIAQAMSVFPKEYEPPAK